MNRLFAAATVALVLAGCSRPAPAPATEPFHEVVPQQPDDGSIPLPRTIPVRSPEQALALGVEFLVQQQSPDGAWRSDIHSTFKDGTALTPLVLCSLLDAADVWQNPAESVAARKKAAAWLAKLAKSDGTIDNGPDGLDFPVYTAALTIKALSHPENGEHRAARSVWVKYLLDRQLIERHGWKPEDKQYGGWGYCRMIPKKPEPNKLAPPLIESNLSATVFALEALNGAGDAEGEIHKAAVIFIRRCQNEDGGFHFIYDDPVRNKAGSPDTPGSKDARFYSYGSTSADGFRAQALCGDDSRLGPGREWLIKNFRADTHPGEYIKSHESNREAVYYYYAATVAKAFRDHKLTLPQGRDWAVELSAELARRQYKDGSWTNPVELVRENDPLVATSNAVTALARCKRK